MATTTAEIKRTPATEQVLGAALNLFTEQGFFNTSIPDIVKASSVSTGSIYHYFRDKEGIARSLYETLVERMESSFSEIEATHATAHDRCRAAIALLFELTEQEPAVMRFMLFSRHKEFIPDQKPVCSSRPFVQMREMVVAGMESGEVREMTPIVAASAVFGGALRLIQLRLDGILDAPLPDYLDEIWQCAWRSVAV
ncbi:TetR/AcrR family transcriptional regulator [Thiohalophilus thiocyanatoxydans]|uniref:TetR family transcriptional regulator n=1 Tax=Thiohalophilus thiocyanatoxydans TaxID=381308 RepID=A0A4R8IJU5_9GAMM|nr:TetR/AcrR family transcriptional regulator [Thiohalophilus thiocyanatoxydans]TDY00628.1 TetR family transcriptional regulator [Thiohalophilus thiocyanatoxydans]